MENQLFSAMLAFAITFFSIPVIIEVSKQKKIFDEPGERKVHRSVIPTLGGLGIFAGFILATLITSPGLSREIQYILASVLILFFLGIKDDILILSAQKKFIGQLVAASVIIYFCNIRIVNMYGFLGIYSLSPVISFILTLFTIVVITNSFNLIDGVDGLAGALGILTSAIFSYYFIVSGQPAFAVMSLSLCGSLLAFLIYNFNPARIFMGDTGSLIIGLLNAVFVIKFISEASEASSPFPLLSAPAIGFAILIVPLFDTLRVFGLRIINKRSPFTPDKNHIHHFLLDLGFNHKNITAALVMVNILFILLAWQLRFLGSTYVFAALVVIAAVIVMLVYYSRSRLRNFTSEKSRSGALPTQKAKVISLRPESVEEESGF